jgi:cell division protein FtsB
MKNQNYQKLLYRLRHRIFTTNNIVVLVALFIAVSWAWGSVNVLQRNYALQREIDDKNRDLKLTQLKVDTERFQQSYYKSDEYKELAVRQRLGLVFPDEKVLILPENSKEAAASDNRNTAQKAITLQPTNVEQWMNFLFGGNRTIDS